MTTPLVVDAHQHFWDPGRATYPWMTDEVAAIRRRFGPEDLRPLLASHGVDRTVLVQARSSVEETKDLLALAAANEFVAGVVGWVDLTNPDVGRTIRRLRSSRHGTRLVGIRHQVHDEPNPNWLLRDDVRKGLRAVGEAGLAYDFLVRIRELPAALRTARDFGDMRFVVDHLGKPSIRGGEDREWTAAMAPFSALPNVYCKLSGMITEAEWTAWRADDLRPYVRRVLDWFGDSRVLFGSDWPVCLLAGSYGDVMEALLHCLRDLPLGARDRIMGGNACRFYRLTGRDDEYAGGAMSERSAHGGGRQGHG